MILNRMEKILMLAEMVNVNRGDDDEDEENARKAADDMEEITVSPHRKKTAARIRLDLDLPPVTLRMAPGNSTDVTIERAPWG